MAAALSNVRKGQILLDNTWLNVKICAMNKQGNTHAFPLGAIRNNLDMEEK